jgi:hypothetical protein
MSVSSLFFNNIDLYDSNLIDFYFKEHLRDMVIKLDVRGQEINLLFKGVVKFDYESIIMKKDFNLDDIYLEAKLPSHLYNSAFHWGICNNIIRDWFFEQNTKELKILSDKFGYQISKLILHCTYGNLLIAFIDVEQIK